MPNHIYQPSLHKRGALFALFFHHTLLAQLSIPLQSTMAGNNKKCILTGPGISSSQTSRTTRSVTNPTPSANPPGVGKSTQAGTSSATSQLELDTDQMLQTEEESTPLARDTLGENPIVWGSTCSPRL